MSITPTWTDAELKEFDKLIDEVSSRNQVTRISGRFAMQKFVETHGKEKCDAMWSHLEAPSDH
jgi:hypothetical protein